MAIHGQLGSPSTRSVTGVKIMSATCLETRLGQAGLHETTRDQCYLAVGEAEDSV